MNNLLLDHSGKTVLFRRTLVTTTIFLCLFGSIRWLSGEALTQHNPTRYTAEAAEAFWRYGSLANPQYETLYKALINESRNSPGDFFWQDMFSVSIDGKLVPQRGMIMAILAAPFWGVSGQFGLWLFNSLLFLVAAAAVFRLTNSIASPLAAAFTVAAIIIGSPLIQFAYGFSHDLYLSACLLASLASAPLAPIFSSLLFVLAVETKQTTLLFAPAVFFLITPPKRKEFVSSLFLLLAALWIWQWQLWGSPLAISYDRVCYFFNGIPHLYNPVALSWNILAARWPDKLFAVPGGFICNNPLFPLAIAGWLIAEREQRRMFMPALIAGFILFLLVHALRFSYVPGFIDNDRSIWDVFGNAARYCLPVSLIYYIGVGIIIDRLRSKQTKPPVPPT